MLEATHSQEWNRPPNIPSMNTPHGLYYSQGLKGKQVEFSTVCHSRFPFCQMTRIPHGGWQQAVWLPSFSLWHRMPVFGKWLPLAPPYGKSNSQSQQRSELIHLKQKKTPEFQVLFKFTRQLKQTVTFCILLKCTRCCYHCSTWKNICWY